MEHRHHRGNTINQLKPEPEIHQHSRERVQSCQKRLFAQLLAGDLTDSFVAEDFGVRFTECLHRLTD